MLSFSFLFMVSNGVGDSQVESLVINAAFRLDLIVELLFVFVDGEARLL